MHKKVKIEFTLLQDGTVCVDGLIDNGLSVSGLCYLLALHTDLLPLKNHREWKVHNQQY